MGNVKLLDCTLRDGGYVNNWRFGYDEIGQILDKLYCAGIDIVEAGFIRNISYDKNISVFPDLNLLDEILFDRKIKKNTMLAVMAEVAHPIPIDKIANADKTKTDIIRVIVWKNKHDADGNIVDVLQEGFEYCKAIVEKGYRVCVQPNRTDQYSDEEFEDMLRLFSQLNPYAIYVVDSWGTMYSSQVIHYMNIAHRVLNKNIAIGFHGHNNMMQAFGTAERIINNKFDRDIIIDASVGGIGRGAGNLNLELIARYINSECGGAYNLEPIYEVYDKYINTLEKKYKWGGSFPYFLSAEYNVNPNYAAFFREKLTIEQMNSIYNNMEKDDAVLYTDDLAKKYANMVLGG